MCRWKFQVWLTYKFVNNTRKLRKEREWNAKFRWRENLSLTKWFFQLTMERKRYGKKYFAEWECCELFSQASFLFLLLDFIPFVHLVFAFGFWICESKHFNANRTKTCASNGNRFLCALIACYCNCYQSFSAAVGHRHCICACVKWIFCVCVLDK